MNNLIFDFGKVLVDYDFELYFSHIVTEPERLKAFSKMLNQKEVAEAMDLGEKTPDEIVAELQLQHPEFTDELQHFADHYPEIVLGEIPGMKDLLTRLKQKGYHLYGLSNWCNKVYETMKEYDIFSLLDGFVVSSDVQMLKPYPEIYQCLFDKFNLNPAECIFTDDKMENIVGSEKAGMKAILFQNAAQLERELKDLGI